MVKSSYLKLSHGVELAYQRMHGAAPGIIFLGGFRSDMTGQKAEALATFCRERRQSFIRFDYQGHGQSTGTFEECTIGTWKEDALSVLTRLTRGPQILIGSSMGGWLAMLLAMAKPRRIAGIIGIAPAPDFTERMLHDRFTDQQRAELKKKGKVVVPSDAGESYPITRQFIEEGRNHLLLHREIPVFCPVRILQGMQDETVPWEMSLAINEKIASQDVKTILIKDGDHRLSEPQDIEKLLSVTGKMLEMLRAEKHAKSA
jgi:pimeloyl-ACP methyl ester carboxylesterase